MEKIPYDDLQKEALAHPQETVEQIMRRLNLDISNEKTVARVYGILEQTAQYRTVIARTKQGHQMDNEPTELPKFAKDFSCPKCGSDKCGTRLDEQPSSSQDHERRRRLGWPRSGELMVQSCQICGHVKVSRPLDFQELQS